MFQGNTWKSPYPCLNQTLAHIFPWAEAFTASLKLRFASSLCSAEFNMFHMIAVGLSSSILGCLLTLLVYTYCQRYQQQSHDATVIHPVSPAPLNTSITNHINKLDKYDSVEAIKVSLAGSYSIRLDNISPLSREFSLLLFHGGIWAQLLLTVNDKSRFHLRFCNCRSFHLSIPVRKEVGFCMCVYIYSADFSGKKANHSSCFVGFFS